MDWRRYMLGQLKNRMLINEWIQNDAFPRFLILVGDKGSGRKTLSYLIARELEADITFPELSVDDVRNVINSAYFCNTSILYVFADADKMSTQAKNALLKVTEEVPKKAYFIITVQNIETIPLPLVSRSIRINMEPYSHEELEQFIGGADPTLLHLANTPGKIIELSTSLNIGEFFSFIEQVLQSIGTVTGVNAFKIAMRMKFKEDGDGYDPIIFLKGVMFMCLRQMLTLMNTDEGVAIFLKLDSTVKCCSKYISQLKLIGVRKDSTFDQWILDMRDIWRD